MTVSGASYDSVSFDLSTITNSPTGMFLKPDGTKMYITGPFGSLANVFEFDFGTNYDVSTLSWNGTSRFEVATQEGNARDVFFKPDGTKMYIVGYNTDAVHQYTLSSPWDVTTASYDSVSKSVAAQTDNPEDLVISGTGDVMFVADSDNEAIHEYVLSTPWNVSTATYSSGNSLSVSSQETAIQGLTVTDNGTRLFFIGSNADIVREYHLSLSWSLSTAVDSGNFLNVSTEDLVPLGMAIGGGKLFMIGFNTLKIHQYSL